MIIKLDSSVSQMSEVCRDDKIMGSSRALKALSVRLGSPNQMAQAVLLMNLDNYDETKTRPNNYASDPANATAFADSTCLLSSGFRPDQGRRFKSGRRHTH